MLIFPLFPALVGMSGKACMMNVASPKPILHDGIMRASSSTVAVLAVLRNSPGNVMRAVAQNRIFDELGFISYLYIEKELVEPFGLQEGYRLLHSEHEVLALRPRVLVINNMAVSNPRFARAVRKQGGRVFYILHEPFQGIRRCLDEGIKKQAKLIGVHALNVLTCLNVDEVLLPSEVSLCGYRKYMAWCNRNYRVFPLSYSDDGHNVPHEERRYVSYIGTFAESHAASEFLGFVRYAAERDDSIAFEIATCSTMADRIKGGPFDRLEREGRLVVTEGRNLSEVEIASAYGRAVCVWGAYRSSTQSGVAISSMQMGAPLIATRTGIAGQLGEGVQYVSSPTAYGEILAAVKRVRNRLPHYSAAARRVYEEQFDYKNFLGLAAEVFGRPAATGYAVENSEVRL